MDVTTNLFFRIRSPIVIKSFNNYRRENDLYYLPLLSLVWGIFKKVYQISFTFSLAFNCLSAFKENCLFIQKAEWNKEGEEERGKIGGKEGQGREGNERGEERKGEEKREGRRKDIQIFRPLVYSLIAHITRTGPGGKPVPETQSGSPPGDGRYPSVTTVPGSTIPGAESLTGSTAAKPDLAFQCGVQHCKWL